MRAPSEGSGSPGQDQAPKTAGAYGRKHQPGFPPACLACRNKKMRCVRDSPDSAGCHRCVRLGLECETVPLLKVGRKKGGASSSSGQQQRHRDTTSMERTIAALQEELRKRSDGSSTSQPAQIDTDMNTAGNATRRSAAADLNFEDSAMMQDASHQQPDIEVSSNPPGSAFPLPSRSQNSLSTMLVSDEPWVAYLNEQPPGLTFPQPAMTIPAMPVPQRSAAGSSGSPQTSITASQTAASTATPSTTGTSDQSLPPKTRQTLDPRAHNPLGVLAHAAENETGREVPITSWDLSSMMQDQSGALVFASQLIQDSNTVQVGSKVDNTRASMGLASLFSAVQVTETGSGLGYYRNQPGLRRDIDPAHDPLALGLVDEDMLEPLFATYFAKLNPFLGILDESLHTPKFVRRRSVFLLTWILASAAQFSEHSSSLAIRLRTHGEMLAKLMHVSGNNSVEIIQAYYIAIVWHKPAPSIAEERTWLYTHHLFGLVQELGLGQSAWGSWSEKDVTGTVAGVGSIEVHPLRPPITIKGKTSQAPKWFDELCLEEAVGSSVDQEAKTQRLLRNGERTYLRVFIWEKALSASFGRASYFSDPSLTCDVDTWWTHLQATSLDRYTSALTIMRSLFARLPQDIMNHMEMPYFNSNSTRIHDYINEVLQPWVVKWLGCNERMPGEDLPRTYMRTAFNHGRLWLSSFTLLSRIPRMDSSRISEMTCFNIAIEVSEGLLSDCDRSGPILYGMMTPTWAMAAYACHLAVRLFPAVYSNSPSITAKLLGLCAEVATALEKAGTTPPHRFSSAAIFGRHLRLILRAKARDLLESQKAKSIQALDPLHGADWHNQTTYGLLSRGASPTAVLSSNYLDSMNNNLPSANDMQWLWNDTAWADILHGCMEGSSTDLQTG